MGKLVRIGGPHLMYGQRTWFDDAQKPIYSPDDIERETIYGADAINAMSRPGAKLVTAQPGGAWVEIGVHDALAIIEIDPSLVWCIVPVRDANGRDMPKRGAVPVAWEMVHAPFGATYPIEQIRNVEHYLTRGLATVIDEPTPPAPAPARVVKAAKPEPVRDAGSEDAAAS